MRHLLFLLCAAFLLTACTTMQETQDSLVSLWEGDPQAEQFEAEAARLPVPELNDVPNDAEVLARSSEELEFMQDSLEADRNLAMQQADFFAGRGPEPVLPLRRTLQEPQLMTAQPMPMRPQSSMGDLLPFPAQPRPMPIPPLPSAMQMPQPMQPAPNYGQGSIAQALGYVPPSVAGFVPPQAPLAPMPGMMPMHQQPMMAAAPMAYGTPGALESAIFFRHGSAKLDAADRKNLADIAQRLRSSVAPVRIVAHASERAEVNSPLERKLINLQMSLKRASTVAKELAKQGVPANKMVLSAHGDSFAGQTPQEAEARRVNLLFD